MKRLLLVLLAVTPLLADGTMVVRRVAPAVTADFVNETFDPAGYSTGACGGAPCGTWTETLSGSGAVVDEDEVALCPAATGFSTQCLETTCGAANRKEYTILDTGTANTGTLYTTVYVAVHGLTGGVGWTDGESQPIAIASSVNSGTPSTSSGAWAISLVYDADGAQAPSPACSPASACFRFETKCGATAEAAQYLQAVADTAYRFRFLTTPGVNGTCQAFIDSTQVVTNADNTAGAYQFIWLGPWEFSQDAQTQLFDGLTVSTVGYVP